ncbi:unnamed protein product [Rotaria sordida]|uniref:Uncharacterized protein n=1 Tax=Rotaria sordida TaxID=392033 RepID=A0A819SA22_9BILA|nr:unnamed protein product [Rotaria sordida]CAF4059889.1 unnamed protein product [Rotaria sordida]
MRRENGTAALISVFETWKSTLYFIRLTILPPTPISLPSIKIPDDMHYNNTQQEFLFCNSATPHKIIAFASEQALELLSKNLSSILIDFQQGMINVTDDIFPQALVKRYNFHYAQNIWKKVKKRNLVKLSKHENICR